MPHRSHAVPLSAAALAVGLVFAGAASAQNRPWYIGVSQGFTHESNIFKSAGGSETSDTVSSTGLLAGVNLELGRQRLHADLTANSNKHQDLDFLDNTSYSLSGGLAWETVGNLSGNIRLSGSQNLGDYGMFGAQPVKNVQTVRQAGATARWGYKSRMGIEGGLDRRTVKYSASNEYDMEIDGANLGIRWGTPGSVLTYGFSVRVTDGQRPHYRALLDPLFPILGYGPEQPDDFDRRDLDFNVTWIPSALSTLNARISATKENHSVDSLPDVSGLTGAVEWNYKPTAKLNLSAELVRDTGVQTAFIESLLPGLQPVRTDNDRINTILSLNANYEVTPKIGLSAGLRRTRGSVTSAAGRSFGDSTNQFTLGASYQPLRALSLSCNFLRTSQARYDADTFGCSAQFVLR